MALVSLLLPAFFFEDDSDIVLIKLFFHSNCAKVIFTLQNSQSRYQSNLGSRTSSFTLSRCQIIMKIIKKIRGYPLGSENSG